MPRSEGQRESRRQEERLAKKTGGRRTAASGAFWHQKGDVRTSNVLWECKWTGKTQVTVKASVLEKIHEEAILDGRLPAVAISLNGRNYVILDENDAIDLLGDG